MFEIQNVGNIYIYIYIYIIYIYIYIYTAFSISNMFD